jgi:hypothetical protein
MPSADLPQLHLEEREMVGRSHSMVSGSGLLVVLAVTVCSGLQAYEASTMPQPQTSPYVLKKEDAEKARKIAFESMEKGRDEKVFYTKAELVPSKALDMQRGPGVVIVTHYKPKGDIAVISTVDLATNKVLSTRSVPHLPTPLSEEEFSEAKQKALAH